MQDDKISFLVSLVTENFKPDIEDELIENKYNLSDFTYIDFYKVCEVVLKKHKRTLLLNKNKDIELYKLKEEQIKEFENNLLKIKEKGYNKCF
ncbi:hypothetical protein D3C81_08260 [compost metagenome]